MNMKTIGLGLCIIGLVLTQIFSQQLSEETNRVNVYDISINNHIKKYQEGYIYDMNDKNAPGMSLSGLPTTSREKTADVSKNTKNYYIKD